MSNLVILKNGIAVTSEQKVVPSKPDFKTPSKMAIAFGTVIDTVCGLASRIFKQPYHKILHKEEVLGETTYFDMNALKKKAGTENENAAIGFLRQHFNNVERVYKLTGSESNLQAKFVAYVK